MIIQYCECNSVTLAREMSVKYVICSLHYLKSIAVVLVLVFLLITRQEELMGYFNGHPWPGIRGELKEPEFESSG